MRKILLILLVVFLLSQAIFFVLKCFLTDVPYTVVTRLNIIVFQQFVMIFGSIFIWWNLSAVTDGVLSDLPLQPSYRCWRTVCVQKFLKAAIILLLFLVHISSTFYYLWIGEEPNIFAMIALTSVAVYIYLIFFLLTFVLIQSVFRRMLRMNSKHFRFLRLLVANELSNRIFAIVLAVVFVLAGLWVTLLPPAVRRITIEIDNLPEAQKGFTVGLLSDLHIGPTVGCSKIQKMVNTINLFKPDVIAISGDLVDGFVRNLEKAAYPLMNLTSKYGVYFATGNHEYLHGNVDEWFVFLKKIKIIPLHNKNKKILVGNSRICIAGTDDLFAEQSRFSGHIMDYKKALRGCNKNDTTIMLIHQPNAVRIILNDVETAKNIDLILSGHTHGGQMYVFVPLVYFWNAYFRGLYYNKTTGTYVYVSAGVNYFGPPVKIFDGNEIIIIKLV
uniref:Calcineurin-like phosphoesterase domain-containing protein n=1 Tax=Wuchereria bancrofti TaxID=6293 RepID=A0AAF5PHG5_WUCBA